jgi:hypothetical protein
MSHWSTNEVYKQAVARGLSYGVAPSTINQVNEHGTRPPLDMSPSGGPRNCRVYVAFLNYQNNEYEQERSMRDYVLLPMNWLTVQLTGRPFIHVQLVFWDALRKTYVTFSVDSAHPVHVLSTKGFRAGWSFVQLDLTEREEIAVYNFCVAQLGKPLNTAGQLWIFLKPVSGRGNSVFCSELVVQALESAGLVDYAVWPEVKEAAGAAPHNLFDYLTKYCRRCPTTLMLANPVHMIAVHREAQTRGKIDLPVGGLPISIVDHVTSDLTSQLAAMPLTTPAPARSMSSLDSLLIKK